MSDNLNTEAPFAYLNRPCVTQWGAGAEAATWQQDPSTLIMALEKIMKLAHSDKKDGTSFCQGALKPGKTRRQAVEMDRLEFCGFDVESGELPGAVAERAKALGLYVDIYPTFNSDKPETRIATDKVMMFVNKDKRWSKLGPDDPANAEQVLAYCKERKGWQPHIMASAKFESVDGEGYVVSHAPFPRFRALIPFTQPLILTKLSLTFAGRKTKWILMRKEIGDLFGIIDYDEKCDDLHRLFYKHRRPYGAPDEAIRVIGAGIDPYELKAFTVKLEEHATKNGGDNRQHRREKQTYQTSWLGTELQKCKGHFRAADFVRDFGESIEKEGGAVATKCFNPHESGVNGPEDVWVMNSADAQNEAGWFVFKCNLHNTCSELRGAGLLDLFIVEHDISKEDFLPYVDRTAELDLAAEIAAAIATINMESTTADMEAVLRLLARRPAGLQDEIDLETLKNCGPYGKRPLRTGLTAYRKEHAGESEPQADEESVSVAEYCAALRRTVEGGNVPPTMFMREDGCKMRLNASGGKTRIEELDAPAWEHELHARTDVTVALKGVETAIIKGDPNWNLPIFESITYVPVFGRDGTLRTTPGYDEATKAYLVPGFEIIPLPEVVTDDDVNKALDSLEEAGRDLPFSDNFDGGDPLPIYSDDYDETGWALPNCDRGKSSRAHWLAMIIQPFVRQMIDGPLPMYNVDKTTNGEGGSLLTWAPSIIYDGEELSPMPMAKNGDEFQKAMLATLRRGPAFVLFDNKNAGQTIDNGDLAAAATASKYAGRELGHTRIIEVKVVGSFIFTGVGTEFSGELKRRCVPIKIDAGKEDPTIGRDFKYDFAGYLKGNRKELVWAVHCLVRNWIQRGTKRGVRSLASFEAWSGVLGGILEAAGVEGFLESLEAYRAGDAGGTERVDERGLVEQLALLFGGGPFGTHELLTQPLLIEALEAADLLPRFKENDHKNKIKLAGYIRKKIAGRTWNVSSEAAKKRLGVLRESSLESSAAPLEVVVKVSLHDHARRWVLVLKG